MVYAQPMHEDDMRAILADLIKLAGLPAPDGDIPADTAHEALDKLKQTMAQLRRGATEGGGSGGHAPQAVADRHKNILIAGQLGIIIHQLRQAITKLDGEVSIAKEVDDAIAEYQKRDYSLVIIDLYMPTEREGLIVLEEIKRISVVCHIPTQIIVLAPLTKDKTIRERCKAKGATFFLEKVEGWHKIILKYYQGEIISDELE